MIRTTVKMAAAAVGATLVRMLFVGVFVGALHCRWPAWPPLARLPADRRRRRSATWTGKHVASHTVAVRAAMLARPRRGPPRAP